MNCQIILTKFVSLSKQNTELHSHEIDIIIFIIDLTFKLQWTVINFLLIFAIFVNSVEKYTEMLTVT